MSLFTTKDEKAISLSASQAINKTTGWLTRLRPS